MTRKSDIISAPMYRGRSLARLEQLEHGMFATVKRLSDGNLHVRFKTMNETWLWRSRGGGWFEEDTRIE